MSVTVRRRVWWRLILPALGLLLLVPLAGGDFFAGEYQVAAGAMLLLVGVVALLPWLIEAVVRRIRGGWVPWQLAIRRLQLDSATSARLVSGIAVAVAGTIGLQMLFAGVESDFTEQTGQDPDRAQLQVQMFDLDAAAATSALRRLDATTGVQGSTGVYSAMAFPARPAGSKPQIPTPLLVGDCATLAEFAAVGPCADGDAFLVARADEIDDLKVAPGAVLRIGEDGPKWTVPALRTVPARPSPAGFEHSGLLLTTGALDVAALPSVGIQSFLRLDRGQPDATEHVRNTAAGIDPLGFVLTLQRTEQSRRFVNVQRGLYAGIVVTLLLIGASMLVGVLEQLRERRRLLAMLVAVGTPRATLSWSVLWQTIVPVALGLALAVTFGIGLGAMLLRIVEAPVRVDWAVVAGSTGLAAVVVLLVTGLSLPALWRLLRPDGLRTE